MNIKNNIKRFISYFTNKKIFVDRDIDIHNDSNVINKKRINQISPKYKLRENLGNFELYGTIRDNSNKLKYKLIHNETKTIIYVTESMFKLIFERE